jgi:formylglycine-generating enzyme required for sulfatase activity
MSDAALLPTSLQHHGFSIVTISDIAYIRAPLCSVPAGPFIMGSDKAHDSHSSKSERPRRTMTLDEEYWIGRFPVTVAEYSYAVRNEIVPIPPTYEGVRWSDQLLRADHPVVNISWYDAIAYAEWLCHVTGEQWGLPTEEEWEKAARGTDGRIYPWGDDWQRRAANIYHQKELTTSPVGAYPQDVSPYGVYDMAGNVTEWTSTSHSYDYHDTYNGIHVEKIRYGLKGGSWFLTPRRARSADRSVDAAESYCSMVGMRLAMYRNAGYSSGVGS